MALPSSPPLLPEQDLPTSPTFLSIAGASTRKRQLSDYGSMSSDPLFSDNTSDGDAGHYDEQPRRKRLVRGPWWSVGKKRESSLRRSVAKKEGKRNADSGVWMGSDVSEESTESILGSQQRLQELAVEDEMDVETKIETKIDEVTKVEETTKSGKPRPDAKMLAVRFVQMCVDTGQESVDLSDFGLSYISNATLRPLHQLIRNTFANFTHPPSEDEFGPLTPSIQLYLSGNQLTALPSELFTLTNITVLSLRNNELSEIPPAIGRLDKLKELNISGNGLRYLPWELLELLDGREKQRQITVRPNPLMEPCDISGPNPLPIPDLRHVMASGEFDTWVVEDYIEFLRRVYKEEGHHYSMRGELELRLKQARLMQNGHMEDVSIASGAAQISPDVELMYLASSAVRYFGIDGTPLRRADSGKAESDTLAAVLDPTAAAPAAAGNSTPSLFELTLRSLQSNFNLPDFLPHMADAGLSSTLASAFYRAAANSAEHGNETCSTCRRQLIVARAEWMEYWYHGSSMQWELTPESVLPFLRKASIDIRTPKQPVAAVDQAVKQKIHFNPQPTTEPTNNCWTARPGSSIDQGTCAYHKKLLEDARLEALKESQNGKRNTGTVTPSRRFR
ncbi:hypothetical protein LTR08_007875 [Meristemomyces frigidus]|nr:hypothetical protein LTR08_007875 [Meristemomyces frigidus]